MLSPDDLRIATLDRARGALDGHAFALALPQVAPTAVLDDIHRWARAHAADIAATYIANVGQCSMDWPGDLRGGYALNLLNDRAVRELGLLRYAPSVELTARQIAQLPGEKELVAWGRVPLMQLRHCPLRAAWALPGRHDACRRCDGNPDDGAPARLNDLSLTDRRGVRFPLRRIASDAGCVVEVLNSVPMFLLRRRRKLPRASGWLLMLDALEPVEQIVVAHRAALAGAQGDLLAFDGIDTTTGHYFRGVE